MYQIKERTRKMINDLFLNELGMTYDEYEELDFDEQRKVLQNSQNRKTFQSENDRVVMIGSREHAILCGISEKEEVMLADGSIINIEDLQKLEKKLYRD